ncbi:MAG TPA: PilZ domain-containing protein [Terriglobales bacterium]|nr:PilZ domain-containing protein [Terriglobales bacterium]
MDRRQSPRVEVQLPVEVWGMDAFGQPFTNPALVTNMSVNGLVLQGVVRRIRIGEVLDVRMGSEQAQYRVVWIASAGEMGMQRVTETAFLPTSVFVNCAQAAAAC